MNEHDSYSVFPMAIANDMIMAVASEENKEGATEFSIHNVVHLVCNSTSPFRTPISPLKSFLLILRLTCRRSTTGHSISSVVTKVLSIL